MLESNIKKTDPDIRIVSSPDHPVLLSSPDMLVAKSGRINAYYSFKASEKARPKYLLSRLALSRFALPTHCQHILVVTRDVDPLLINIVGQHFEEVVETSEINKSFLILNNVNPHKDSVERASFGREKHYIKYNLMYELSLLQLSSFNQDNRQVEIDSLKYEKASYSNWIDIDLSLRDELFQSKYFQKMARGYFAMPEFERSSRRLDLLKKICLSAMQLDSKIDNGVFIDDYEDVKLVLARELPGYRHDELKGVRGAAFAGLGLSHARNDESLGKYSEFISYQLERGLSEYYRQKNRYNKSHSRRK